MKTEETLVSRAQDFWLKVGMDEVCLSPVTNKVQNISEEKDPKFSWIQNSL